MSASAFNQSLVESEIPFESIVIAPAGAGLELYVRATVGPKSAVIDNVPAIESSLLINMSVPPAEVKLYTPAPGSKSTVSLKYPVVYILPLESITIELL